MNTITSNTPALNKPICVVDNGGFRFIGTASKLMKLSRFMYINIQINTETQNVIFQLLENSIEGAYKLGRYNKNERLYYKVATKKIFSKYTWLKDFVAIAALEQRKFELKSHGNPQDNCWIIQIPTADIKENKYPVKFFSMNDLSISYHLPRALNLIKAFNPDNQNYTLNEVLEIYNVACFSEKGIYMEAWTEVDRVQFINAYKSIRLFVGRYFNSITEETLIDRMEKLYSSYGTDFLKLYDQYKLAQEISEQYFIQAVQICNISLCELLTNKYIVHHYPNYLKEKMLLRPDSAKILFEAYSVEKDPFKDKIYIPQNIDKEEMKKLIEDYVDSDSPNLNYLRQVVDIPKKLKSVITTDICDKAQKKLTAGEDKILEQPSVQNWRFQVMIDDKQQEFILGNNEGNNTKITLSQEWLIKNKGKSLFKLFGLPAWIGLIDEQRRITTLSRASEMEGAELIFTTFQQDTYLENMSFKNLEWMTDAILCIYYIFYSKNLEEDCSLEKDLQWYYATYIKKFGISNFEINMPKPTMTYLEKCQILISELESISKQYRLYALNKSINHNLLRTSHEELRYGELPSLIQKKYVYLSSNNQDNKHILYYLFSNQAGLNRTEQGTSGSTLFDLLNKHPSVKYGDFYKYQQSDIKYLMDQNLLANKKGVITMVNRLKIQILRNMYNYNFIDYSKLKKDNQEEIDSMIDDNILEFRGGIKDALLSSQEADYFDYCLNAKFVNGLKLRNMYAHGLYAGLSEEDHRDNYIKILKLVILLTLKINDEFTLTANNELSKN